MEIEIDTTNGSYQLARSPNATTLNIIGYNVDRDSAPFMFPDEHTFATLYPTVTTICAWLAAIDMPSFLSAIHGVLANLETLEIEGDWGDFPREFRITDVNALTAVVSNALQLTTLTLNGGILVAQDTRPFMRALAVNTTVTHVDLSRSTCGLDEIANVLRTNRTIHTLVIDHMVHDDENAVFANALAANTNPVLRTLSFIGADLVVLANAMRTNTTIVFLTAGPHGEDADDLLDADDVTALNDMLELNRTLTSLTLDGSGEASTDDVHFTPNGVLTHLVLTNFRDMDDDVRLI
jgi:hypothetical protein